MVKRKVWSGTFWGLFALIFISSGPMSLCHAANIDREVEESYLKADYTTTARLLQRRIEQWSAKTSEGENVDFQGLYSNYLLLGHVYAWKLRKSEEALKQFQTASEVRQADERNKGMLPTEFILIAEIYEAKNDFPKATEYYQNLLNALVVAKENENDDFSIMMSEELTRFVKYQIDTINIELKTRNHFEPLLSKLKLTAPSIQAPIYQLLPLAVVPLAKYDMAIAEKADPVAFIKQSPSNISSMVLNFSLVLNASVGSVTDSSEKAMRAYLVKYPESYYSLVLRQMFYRFYWESGQEEKARQILGEMKKIAEKRKMEIITEPDERFSSPERTWETYKGALAEGDLDGIRECYVPGRQRHAFFYAALGKEKMREIGEKMGSMVRVSGSEREARYGVKRIENGKEYTYEIRFYNINGEWKMQEF
ncbi:MAG: hypothetical protein HZB32_00280 [Nitrospirae bacterium]|nr:hypothetical protein [Nitrospirota bacterium]